ncbi:TIGR04282 family arsenosugar biosynthesis glycosyltransferase [Mongoliitalea daihaiensis]|uniref:TIGR04282 family arsenosugar biosynthesis glycosyltransferase n=1 Tax=Mongoliitalea daihaiensis TaxID=2782006 RepID=UPI001F015DDA|nr:TIGR04282 family arsenosugar biosynthesis glycosyltransferase [Mongoliitalea daihaiensis]UJP63427.1 TIGR04282 family arsenosugar biosynthesis glycosyltransferase [Mongoliitalea daihaiensis]
MAVQQEQVRVAAGPLPNFLMKQAVIVFQKALVLGEVKTRLAKSVGAEKALEIYQALITHTHQTIQTLGDTSIFIYQNKFLLGTAVNAPSNFQLKLQHGNDLGDKMKHAFEEVFNLGFEKVLIIGTDCLAIRKHHLKAAFDYLDTHTCVIGPAKDGGYYLLGLTQLTPQLFQNIAWSTSTVYEQTTTILEDLNRSFTCIETLSDIDTADDWHMANL